MPEFRRMMVNGTISTVEVEANHFVWIDGRRFHVDDAIHLPPVQPTKVVCVHLNYRSRLYELGWAQPSAPP